MGPMIHLLIRITANPVSSVSLYSLLRNSRESVRNRGPTLFNHRLFEMTCFLNSFPGGRRRRRQPLNEETLACHCPLTMGAQANCPDCPPLLVGSIRNSCWRRRQSQRKARQAQGLYHGFSLLLLCLLIFCVILFCSLFCLTLFPWFCMVFLCLSRFPQYSNCVNAWCEIQYVSRFFGF